jgi:hypothetical protein
MAGHLDPTTTERQIDRINHPVAEELTITLVASRREPVGSNNSSLPFLNGHTRLSTGHEHQQLTTPNCKVLRNLSDL